MAKKAIIDVVVNDSKAVKATENLDKGFKNVDSSVEDTNKSIEGLTGSLDKMTGGAISGFKGLVNGAKSGIASMKSLKFAIAATGIGALLLAVTSLVSYFTKTERGAQALRTIMAGLGAAMDVVTDLFIQGGEAIFNAFSNPKQAVSDLWEAIKTNVINRVQGVIELFGNLGRAIEAALDFDWDKVGEEIAGAGRNIVQAVSGLDEAQQDSIINFVKETTKEIQNEAKAAIELSDALNQVKVRERELKVERAEANAEIEKQKFIAEDITKTIQEREAATKAAFELEQSLVEKQVSNERERLRIMEAQAALGESNEETLDAIAEQRVRVAEIEQASATKQIELNNKLNSLKNEQRAKDAEYEAQQIEKKKARSEKEATDLALLDETRRTKQEQEIFEAEEKYNKLIALAKIYGQETASIEAKKTKELSDINEKYADYQEQLAQAAIQKKRAEENAKLNIIGGALGAAAGLASEGSDLAKGLGVAAATIQTYQAAVAAYASASAIPVVGWALGPVAAAVAVAAGIKNVKSILGTKSPKPSGKLASYASGSGGGSASASVPRQSGGGKPITPQFNLSGGNNQLSQINESINTRNSEPPKSYVVGSDVSSQQSLDRKIKTNSTF